MKREYFNRWGNGNHFEQTPQLRSFFDGLLLGDGGFSKTRLSAKYQMSQVSIHWDWIEVILSMFGENGITTKTYIIPKYNRISNGININAKESIRLRTIDYRTLLPEYNRWYINGEKVVPKDIDISDPVLLANWYMGDGSLNKNPSWWIQLHTNSFTKLDVEFLIEQFKEKLNIHANIVYWKKQPIIKLHKNNVNKFLDIIASYIVPSFDYKIPKERWIPSKCKICGIEMFELPRQQKYCLTCKFGYKKNS